MDMSREQLEEELRQTYRKFEAAHTAGDAESARQFKQYGTQIEQRLQAIQRQQSAAEPPRGAGEFEPRPADVAPKNPELEGELRQIYEQFEQAHAAGDVETARKLKERGSQIESELGLSKEGGWEKAKGTVATGAAAATQGTLNLSESLWRTPEAIGRYAEGAGQALYDVGVPDWLNPFPAVAMIADKIAKGHDFGSYHAAGTSDVADGINKSLQALPELSDSFKEVAAQNEKSQEALEGLINGRTDLLLGVAKDPEAWAAAIGQGLPTLLAAWKSGGSMPFMAWMEAMEQAGSIAEFEKQTGQKVDPADYAAATAATGAVNALLEKTGLDAILGNLPGGKSLIGRLIVAMGVEGGTEFLQEVTQNATSLIYDEKAVEKLNQAVEDGDVKAVIEQLTEGGLGAAMGGAGLGGGGAALSYAAEKIPGQQEKKKAPVEVYAGRAAEVSAEEMEQLGITERDVGLEVLDRVSSGDPLTEEEMFNLERQGLARFIDPAEGRMALTPEGRRAISRGKERKIEVLDQQVEKYSRQPDMAKLTDSEIRRLARETSLKGYEIDEYIRNLPVPEGKLAEKIAGQKYYGLLGENAPAALMTTAPTRAGVDFAEARVATKNPLQLTQEMFDALTSPQIEYVRRQGFDAIVAPDNQVIPLDPDIVDFFGEGAGDGDLPDEWGLTQSAKQDFIKLADKQRGKPEEAMLKLTSLTHGVMNPLAENVGDLIHRMSEEYALGSSNMGLEFVKPKIDSALRLLRSPYGFEREYNENLKNNYESRKERGGLPDGVETFEDYKAEVARRLKKYAEEHRQLEPFNTPQRLANEAAIAVGESRFADATRALERLKEIADDVDTWNRMARQHPTTVTPSMARSRRRTRSPSGEFYQDRYPRRGDRPVGAPKGVKDINALNRLIKKTVGNLERAEGKQGGRALVPKDSWDWYEDVGKIVRDLVKGDLKEMEKLVRLLALMSPNTSVETNITKWVNGAYAAYKEGRLEDITKIEGALMGKEALVAALNAPQLTIDTRGVGPKVLNFYRNLWDATFEQDMFPDAVTIDLWIMRELGYTVSRKTETISETQYETARKIIVDATEWYNKRNGTSYRPRQFQAALWVLARGGRRGSFASLIRGSSANTAFETIPSESFNEGRVLARLTDEQREAYTEEMLNILDDGSRNKLLDALGLPLYVTKSMRGGYMGTTAPGALMEAPLVKMASEYDRKTADLISKSLQYIYKQDSVIWFRPVLTDAQELPSPNRVGYDQAFSIDFDKALTTEDLAALSMMLEEEFPGQGFTVTEPDQIVLINLDGVDPETWAAPEGEPGSRKWSNSKRKNNEKWTDGIGRFVERASNSFVILDTSGTLTVESSGYRSTTHDWQADPKGQALQAEARQSGPPDLLARLDDWQRAADEVTRRWVGEAATSPRPASAPVPVGRLDGGPRSQVEIYGRFGSLVNRDTTKDLKIYNLQPAIDDPKSTTGKILDDYGYQVEVFSYDEERFRLPDFKRQGYQQGYVWIYDPEVASGSFKDVEYTRAWRVAHEVGHGITEPLVEQKYGPSRRYGRLGREAYLERGTPPKRKPVKHRPLTLREAQRAVEWEDVAFRAQRMLLERVGISITEEQFAQEYNTNIADAVFRTLTGNFGDPGQYGFRPSASRRVRLRDVLESLQRTEQAIAKAQSRKPTSGINLEQWAPITDAEIREALDKRMAQFRDPKDGDDIDESDLRLAVKDGRLVIVPPKKFSRKAKEKTPEQTVEERYGSGVEAMLTEFDQETMVNPLDPRERILNLKSAVTLTPVDKGVVQISSLRSFEVKKGDGGAALSLLINLAEKHGVTLRLDPVPFGDTGMTRENLVDWYERNGFRAMRDYPYEWQRKPGRTVFSRRRTNEGKGLGKIAVQNAVRKAYRSINSAPRVVVLDHIEDLPEAIYLRIKNEENGDLALATTRGVYDSHGLFDTVYLIGANIGSEQEAIDTLFHEIVGHYGTQGVLSTKDWETVMDKIWDSFPDLVTAAADRNGIPLVGKGLSRDDVLRNRRIAAEEVIAYQTERVLKKKTVSEKMREIINDLVEMLRNVYLRILGKDAKITSRQIRSLITEAWNFVHRPGGYKHQVVRMHRRHRRSMHSPWAYSALSRWVLTLPENKRPRSPEQWVSELRAAIKKGTLKAEEIRWTGLDEYLGYTLEGNDFVKSKDPKDSPTKGSIAQGSTFSTEDARRAMVEIYPNDDIAKKVDIWTEGMEQRQALHRDLQRATTGGFNSTAGLPLHRRNDIADQYKRAVLSGTVPSPEPSVFDAWLRLESWEPSDPELDVSMVRTVRAPKYKTYEEFRDAVIVDTGFTQERLKDIHRIAKEINKLSDSLSAVRVDLQNYASQPAPYIPVNAVNEFVRMNGVRVIASPPSFDEDSIFQGIENEIGDLDSAKENGYNRLIDNGAYDTPQELALLESERELIRLERLDVTGQQKIEDDPTYAEALAEIKEEEGWDDDTDEPDMSSSDLSEWWRDIEDKAKERFHEKYYIDNEDRLYDEWADQRTVEHYFQYEEIDIYVHGTYADDDWTVYVGGREAKDEIASSVNWEDISQEVTDHLSNNMSEYGLGTRWSSFVLPGGENYGELLIRWDQDDTLFTADAHWGDEPNVLVHLRYDIRRTPDGELVFFVDELQSDWHQAIREQGIDDPSIVARLESEMFDFYRRYASLYPELHKNVVRALSSMDVVQVLELLDYALLTGGAKNKDGMRSAVRAPTSRLASHDLQDVRSHPIFSRFHTHKLDRAYREALGEIGAMFADWFGQSDFFPDASPEVGKFFGGTQHELMGRGLLDTLQNLEVRLDSGQIITSESGDFRPATMVDPSLQQDNVVFKDAYVHKFLLENGSEVKEKIAKILLKAAAVAENPELSFQAHGNEGVSTGAGVLGANIMFWARNGGRTDTGPLVRWTKTKEVRDAIVGNGLSEAGLASAAGNESDLSRMWVEGAVEYEDHQVDNFPPLNPFRKAVNDAGTIAFEIGERVDKIYSARDGVKEAPFHKTYGILAIKWAIAEAKRRGIKKVAISNGEVHGFRWNDGQLYDRIEVQAGGIDGMDPSKFSDPQADLYPGIGRLVKDTKLESEFKNLSDKGVTTRDFLKGKEDLYWVVTYKMRGDFASMDGVTRFLVTREELGRFFGKPMAAAIERKVDSERAKTGQKNVFVSADAYEEVGYPQATTAAPRTYMAGSRDIYNTIQPNNFTNKFLKKFGARVYWGPIKHDHTGSIDSYLQYGLIPYTEEPFKDALKKRADEIATISKTYARPVEDMARARIGEFGFLVTKQLVGDFERRFNKDVEEGAFGRGEDERGKQLIERVRKGIKHWRSMIGLYAKNIPDSLSDNSARTVRVYSVSLDYDGHLQTEESYGDGTQYPSTYRVTPKAYVDEWSKGYMEERLWEVKRKPQPGSSPLASYYGVHEGGSVGPFLTKAAARAYLYDEVARQLVNEGRNFGAWFIDVEGRLAEEAEQGFTLFSRKPVDYAPERHKDGLNELDEKIEGEGHNNLQRFQNHVLGIVNMENKAAHLEQAFADQFAGIKYALKAYYGDERLPAEIDPYKHAHLTTSPDSQMYVALMEGPLQWKDGVSLINEEVPGLLRILEPVGQRVDEWGKFMVARRAKRLLLEGIKEGAVVTRNLQEYFRRRGDDGFAPSVEFRNIEELREATFNEMANLELPTVYEREVIASGREKLLSAQAIAAGLWLGDAHPEFVSVANDYAKFMKAMLDWAQESGVINPETRPLWENADYIPFYRLRDNTLGMGFEESSGTVPAGMAGRAAVLRQMATRGIANQRSPIRQLRGGESKLGNPLENIIVNLNMLMQTTMRNHAAVLTIDALEGSGIVTPVKGYEFLQQKTIAESDLKRKLANVGIDTADMDEAALNALKKMWVVDAPKDPNVITILKEGKKKYYHIHDELLFRALTAINQRHFQSLFGSLAMSPFRWTKRLLTSMITLSPAFMGANWVRDVPMAFVNSRYASVPNVGRSLQGIGEALTLSKPMLNMMASGAAFYSGYINAADPTSLGKSIRRALRQTEIGGRILNTPLQLFHAYNDLAAAMENSNRIAFGYKPALQKTGSVAEAVFESKDLMNFAKHGDLWLTQFFIQSVPFLNARLQGLLRYGQRQLGEGAAAAGATLLKASLVTLATLALYWGNRDDERYKQLTDEDKDLYWHFWVNGHHWRLPKPFEVGAIFGTVPERLWEWLESDASDSDKVALDRLGWIVKEMFNFDLTQVQALHPLMEAARNFNSFFGGPIVPYYLEKVDPRYQYTETTSPTAREISEWMPYDWALLPDFLESPMMIEHLMRGYFGTIGSYILMATDSALRATDKYPSMPTMRWDQLPVVKRFFRGTQPPIRYEVDENGRTLMVLPRVEEGVEFPRRTSYETMMYEFRKAAVQVEETMRDILEDERVSDAEEAPYLSRRARHFKGMTNEQVLDAVEDVKQASANIRETRKEIDEVIRNEKLTPQQKALRLEKLYREVQQEAITWYLERPGSGIPADKRPRVITEEQLESIRLMKNEEMIRWLGENEMPATRDLVADIANSGGLK